MPGRCLDRRYAGRRMPLASNPHQDPICPLIKMRVAVREPRATSAPTAPTRGAPTTTSILKSNRVRRVCGGMGSPASERDGLAKALLDQAATFGRTPDTTKLLCELEKDATLCRDGMPLRFELLELDR